ncbi:MAG: hypothetical protein P4L59_10780 [Desulfosporosinus sp.]|nr:hypothetical protein [Desulfosporosinus sp.]
MVGIVGSVSGFILWAILNFFNPYSTEGITEATIIRTFWGLGLPAISGLVASVFRIKWLMYVAFIGSLLNDLSKILGEPITNAIEPK